MGAKISHHREPTTVIWNHPVNQRRPPAPAQTVVSVPVVTPAPSVPRKAPVIRRENLCRQIHIRNGSTNHGYDVIFKGLLGDAVRLVYVDDPYIINIGQITNFVKLCELLASGCINLRKIVLTTKRDEKNSPKDQKDRLDQVASSLAERNIVLEVKYSAQLHDREVRFDTGWVVSLGRGLDYFKPIGRFALGSFDLNLRKCHETKITIFHRDFLY